LGEASDAGFDVFAVFGHIFRSQPNLKLFEDIESQRQKRFRWTGIDEIDVLEEYKYFRCMLRCYDLVGDNILQAIE